MEHHNYGYDCVSQCGDTGDAICCDDICCDDDACTTESATFCDFDCCQHEAICHDEACEFTLPCHDDNCVSHDPHPTAIPSQSYLGHDGMPIISQPDPGLTMLSYMGGMDAAQYNAFFPSELPLVPTPHDQDWTYSNHQLHDIDQSNNYAITAASNFFVPSSTPETPTTTFSMPRLVSNTPVSLSSVEAAPLGFVGQESAADPQPSPAKGLMCKWRLDPHSENICGHVCETEIDLQEHCKVAHARPLGRGPSGFHCQWLGCERANPFNQKSKLERHLQVHTGFKPVQCSICKIQLSAKQSLEQHMRTHTGEKPWACPIEGCTQAFKQQSALTMHLRTHTGEKPLACEFCGKTFGESSNLSKHRKTHESKGTHVCLTCGRDFHRLDQLRRHRKTHERKAGGSGTVSQSPVSTASTGVDL